MTFCNGLLGSGFAHGRGGGGLAGNPGPGVEAFGGWTKTFTDPRPCAAIVNRLTFGGNIIETGTGSYRLAQAHART